MGRRTLLTVLVAIGALAVAVGQAAAATWTSPAGVVSTAATSGESPVAVVDRFGTTTLAWVQPLAAPRYGSRIWVTRSGPTGWTTSTAVSVDEEVYASRPRLAVESDGDVRLVWQQTRTGVHFTHKYVLTRTFDRAAGSWGDVQQIAADGIDSLSPEPEIAIGPNGVAYVAYRRFSSGTTTPMVAESTEAGWTTPIAVPSSATADLRIGVPEAGTPVIVWADSGSIKASHWTGDAFTTPATTGTGEGTVVESPALAVADGRVTYVWSSLLQMCFTFPCTSWSKIWTARYRIDGGWDGSQLFSTGTRDTQPAVATTPSGDDVIVWLEGATPAANVKLRVRAAGGTSGTVQQIASSTGGNDLVDVDVDPAGATTVAWARGTSAPYTPTTARFDGASWVTTAFATTAEMYRPTLASGGSAVASVTVAAWGARSSSVSAVASLLVTAPDGPTGVVLGVPARRTAAVSFAAPASDGGAAISGFRVSCTSSDGGTTRTATGSASPIEVTDLDYGATYSCTAAAQNGEGWSEESAASAPVLVPIAVPLAPTGVATGAVTADRAVEVAYEEPTDIGGSRLLSARATCTSDDGGTTREATGTPLVVADLTAGRSYTCVVAVRNAAGWSDDSAASTPAVTVPVPPATASPVGIDAAPPSASTGAAAAPSAATGFRLTAAPEPARGGAGGRIETTIVVGGPGTILQTGSTNRRTRAAGAPACRGARTVRAAGRYVVTCRLSNSARAALLRGPLRLVVVTTFRGADGSTASQRAVVRLAQVRLPSPAPSTTSSAVTG